MSAFGTDLVLYDGMKVSVMMQGYLKSGKPRIRISRATRKRALCLEQKSKRCESLPLIEKKNSCVSAKNADFSENSAALDDDWEDNTRRK